MVRWVAFRYWRGTLGRVGSAASPHSGPVGACASLRARRSSRAVQQAARRLPGETLCLPRAMALAWMLRRRAIPATVVLGVAESAQRGTLDDLHAWVTCDGEVILGQLDQVHRPVLILRQGPTPQ